MELPSAAVMASAISTLAPLALYVGRSCMSRIRDTKRIKKICLVLPRKGGKGFLTSALGQSQRDFLMVDTDELMRSVCDEKEVSHLDNAREAGRLFEASLLYNEMAQKVLAYVKEKQKLNRGLRVLFVTSSFEFSKCFKPDAVFLASPDSQFFERILEAYTPEEREALRRHRTEFMEAVPDKRAVGVYTSYEELEKLVRNRLGIQRHL